MSKVNEPTFNDLKKALQKQIKSMEALGLYSVDMNKDELYDLYLNSFPAGTNNIYKERREYDCNYCKQFVRNIGLAVAINDNYELVSIWDIKIGGYYQAVVDALSAAVKAKAIANEYLHFEPKISVERSVVFGSSPIKTFDHLAVELAPQFVLTNGGIASKLSDSRSNKEVLKRSLEELTEDAAETIIDLIAQGSLYRGEEKLRTVETFLKLKRAFNKLVTEEERDNFSWAKSKILGGASKIRNDAVGTLLIDLSEGMDLEEAVKRWEKVMAPTNYKRPTALVTPAMVSAAEVKVIELGLTDSLQRRFAVVEDLTINNVLFADRSARKAMNVFDDLKASTATINKKSLDKVEEVTIDNFLKDILPKAQTLEVLVENKHTNNLVSLISPATAGAPGLFKWKSGFSWSYNGEVTDSIKERVKSAGGNVTGDLRVSLSWYNSDDLDLWVYEPNNNKIYHGDRHSVRTGGVLDVDMNAYGKQDEHTPVENITWAKESKMCEGKYRVVINNYNQRMKDRVGFVVEVEYKGQLFTFDHPQELTGNKQVVEFSYTHAGGVVIGDSIGHTKASKEVWDINTEQFQKVSLVLNSPNHWDGEETGNKHVFFMLEGCKNPTGTRGFYNEYLKEELTAHRKVFEVLGSKLKVEHSDNQLSGLGFSSTNRNSVYVRVGGSFTRTLKINF